MERKRTMIFIAVVAVLIIVIALASRQWTVRHIYFSYANKIVYKMNPEQKAKYFEDYDYTVKKFWQLYTRKVMTRNDLNDVVWKMKRLSKKSELKDSEVFDFIGYVSRLYTDALARKHREQLGKGQNR